jgi:quercetin dioxygenase-like cupin family protein
MKNRNKKFVSLASLLILGTMSTLSFAVSDKNPSNNTTIQPMIAHQIFEKAKKNKNWKSAFVTGKHNQVVFMNISSNTNPRNEIGMETHPFDQIILIVKGQGKADLGGEKSSVKSGDMLFIPQGTAHNIINSNEKNDLKIVSIYSDTDIPANSTYKKKEDESKANQDELIKN